MSQFCDRWRSIASRYSPANTGFDVRDAERHGQRVAVLFLDLDNFEVINDSLGHQAGDTLLIEVARRLRTCLRASETVARFGGDEFTLLLDELEDESEASLVADLVAQALRAPMRLPNEMSSSAPASAWRSARPASRHLAPQCRYRHVSVNLWGRFPRSVP
jgi:diguanylate cyclase (GGDEF)-like protein